MAATPDGGGYWLVASDGGVFSFGDAPFHGSTGGTPGSSVVALVPGSSSYEEVNSDGVWIAFPDASRSGSAPLPTPPILPTSAPGRTGGSKVNLAGPHLAGGALVSAAGSPLRLIGTNVSGSEDRCLSGLGLSWGPTNLTEAKIIASWGANAVRVQLNEDCWLGLNGLPGAYSAMQYRLWVEQWVEAINEAGMVAILDLQWSAPGDLQANQQWPMADANHSVSFWYDVAHAFSTHPGVIFDLFGEPFIGKGDPTAADWSCWRNGCLTTFKYCETNGLVTKNLKKLAGCTNVIYQTAGMQKLVDAVRYTGAKQPIMLGGLKLVRRSLRG